MDGATVLLYVEKAAFGRGFCVWEIGRGLANVGSVGDVGVALDGGEGFRSWGR